MSQTQNVIDINTNELLGRYKPIEKMTMHHAYFGVLYKGKALIKRNGLNRGTQVAMKKLTNIFRSEIRSKYVLRELRILHRLSDHENIVKLYDIIPPKQYQFNELILIFEHADADLERIFKTNQFFSHLHVAYMLYHILLGLKYIHSCKMVHLNLRPRNILINADCNFRLAQNLCESGGETELWGKQNRWYSAPEVVTATGKASELYAVDMWSVGAIFAELLQMQQTLCPNPPQRHRVFLTDRDVAGMSHHKRLYSDRMDQLQKIFDVIGYDQMPFSYFFNSLQRNKTKCELNEMYGGMDHNAKHLLKQLLKFDVRERINVDNALRHKYFSDVRDVPKEKVLKPDVFEASNRVTTREFILSEALKYNENMDEDKVIIEMREMDNYLEQQILLINGYCKRTLFCLVPIEIRHLIIKFVCCCLYSYNDDIMQKCEEVYDVPIAVVKMNQLQEIYKECMHLHQSITETLSHVSTRPKNKNQRLNCHYNLCNYVETRL